MRNRFKGLDLIDRVPDELWTEVQSGKEPLHGTEDVVDGETAESPHEQKGSSQSLEHTLHSFSFQHHHVEGASIMAIL